MRRCTKCAVDKPVAEFYSNTNWCKSCSKEAARKRYHKRKERSPEKVRKETAASSRKYYARIRAEGGSLNEALKAKTRMRVRRGRGLDDAYWYHILEHDPCSYCGNKAGQIDHIEPWIRTHENGWDNLTAACGVCNWSKRDHSLLRFLLRH